MKIDREQLTLRSRAAWRRAARRLGWQLVRADAYSPIVELDSLAPDTFERAAPMPGVRLDLDEQLALIEQLRAPIESWRPPLRPPGDELGFHLENSFYGPLDAHVLYGLIRERRPACVLELGSGYSSLVIAHAARENAALGAPIEHTIVDPAISPLAERLEDARLIRHGAERLPLEQFESLAAGDLLFVDTSHTVRVGGEVVQLVLEVLPTLAPGVLIHFHDFFRPFEYPRVLIERFNLHWQEQYLLQAFLAYNEGFKVLCANHALARLRRAQLAALVPSLGPEMAPSALWIEKLA